MRCSIIYLEMFYGVFSNVHLVYMCCSIVYFRISEKYTRDIFKIFSIICFSFFFLMHCSRFYYFLFMLCI